MLNTEDIDKCHMKYFTRDIINVACLISLNSSTGSKHCKKKIQKTLNKDSFHILEAYKGVFINKTSHADFHILVHALFHTCQHLCWVYTCKITLSLQSRMLDFTKLILK